MSSPSCVIFPSFAVIDASWGPVWLNISDVCGILIESKSDTGNILEYWRWNETSHVTIKKMSTLLVQLKKLSGVKKVINFSSIHELDRFERVLNNAVPILTVSNMKRQRKFVIIQAPHARSDKFPNTVPIIVSTDLNSNVQGTGGASAIPPPSPPPPPMVSQAKFITKAQDEAKPKKQVDIGTNFAVNEIQKVFAHGILKPSDVIRAAKSGLSTALMMDKNIPATENPSSSIKSEESKKLDGSNNV